LSLSEKLMNPISPQNGGKPCSIKMLLNSLEGLEKDALLKALRIDSGWAHTVLRQVLNDEGHHISIGSLTRHRLGSCACRKG
jgi:hypothetical protein